MPEKIEIIYDFNGYADPGIKKVKLTRVNGYRTKIIKEGEKEMEEYKLTNLTGSKAKEILELADQKDIDIEKIIEFIKKLKGEKIKMTEKTNDEIRFNEEEKKVQEFMAKPENKGVSYRQAVLTVLDRSEPETKKEFTEEEKENIKKEEENIKKVEKYLEENPKIEYREAVKIVLNKDELNENEKKVEEFIEKCKSQGIEVSYRQAVLKVLDKSEPEPKKEE
ncbi:hypothetical protein ES695_01730 [Candidatus Atribacteria bacterium 1244-E10-H5-B2]|nr:MAG: hypothetical protein ES695_01730 [Candidatus Atribacteria bacterium 1244-E10-H5-B2]